MSSSIAPKPHPNFRTIYPPHPHPASQNTEPNPTVFLAGTIDNPPDSYPTWRSTLTSSLSYLPITLLNPYTPSWDSSWKEDISFSPFKKQVEWELDMQEVASVVVIFFSGPGRERSGEGKMAPISLLELGLAMGRDRGNVVVGVEEGYVKRGNVQVVCQRLGVKHNLPQNLQIFAPLMHYSQNRVIFLRFKHQRLDGGREAKIVEDFGKSTINEKTTSAWSRWNWNDGRWERYRVDSEVAEKLEVLDDRQILIVAFWNSIWILRSEIGLEAHPQVSKVTGLFFYRGS
ncbi:hypothetical protein B7494_g7444 [Chlorociboria aeruginascens]|nr:hypothetical protein B7494_g7444 [Chlorociboria aeruginascens]